MPYVDLYSAAGTAIARLDMSSDCSSPYGTTVYGVHLALHPTSGVGFASCQGHGSDPIKFRRFSTTGTWLDATATVITSRSSWYDSHVLGMTASGGPVVLWSAYATPSSLQAAIYDSNRTLLSSITVKPLSQSSIDTFRRRHTKLQVVGSDILLPYFEPDGTTTFKFNAYARYDSSGALVETVSTPGVDTSTLVQAAGINWTIKSGALVRNGVTIR
jgi:hypothetical protein